MQDKNGHVEVKLKGNERIFFRCEDLTLYPLECTIIVKSPEGKESELDDKAKYDGKTRKGVDELKDALGINGPSGSLSEIVEREIQEAIKRK